MYDRLKFGYILLPGKSAHATSPKESITGQEGNLKNEEDVNIIKTPLKERNIRNLRNEDDLKTEDNIKKFRKAD